MKNGRRNASARLGMHQFRPMTFCASSLSIARHTTGLCPLFIYTAARWTLYQTHRDLLVCTEPFPRTRQFPDRLRRYRSDKNRAAEKLYRDVTLCRIGQGTSEIHGLVIARQLLKD